MSTSARVEGFLLPTAEDAQRVIQYVEFEWTAPAAMFAPSSQTFSNPTASTTTTGGVGGAESGSQVHSRSVMLPVSEEELRGLENESVGTPQSAEEKKMQPPPAAHIDHDSRKILCDELKSTFLGLLADLSASSKYYAPSSSVGADPVGGSGADVNQLPFTAVSSPRYLFAGDGAAGTHRGTVIRLRSNALSHQAALRRSRTYFGLHTATAAGEDVPPDCVLVSFDAFSQAAEALMVWATRTLEVTAAAAAEDQTPSLLAQGFLPGGAASAPGSGIGAPGNPDARVFDVSDVFFPLKARSEAFLVPDAYSFDPRTQSRLLESKHFQGLKTLVRDLDVESRRLRDIEAMYQQRASEKRSSTNNSPQQQQQQQQQHPSSSSGGGAQFYPRIGEFEYLRDSLQLVLNMAITEGELSSLEQFRGLYETLAEEFQQLQAELVGLYNIVLPGQFASTSASTPRAAAAGGASQTSPPTAGSTPSPGRSAAAPLSAPSADTIGRFRDFRAKLKTTRNSFLKDMQKKNLTHAQLVAAQPATAGQKKSWWNFFGSAASTGKSLLLCQAEVPAQTTGKSPLLEQKQQLLRCYDDLRAHSESTAVLLEKKYPELFSRSWGWTEHLNVAAKNLTAQVAARLNQVGSALRLPGSKNATPQRLKYDEAPDTGRNNDFEYPAQHLNMQPTTTHAEA